MFRRSNENDCGTQATGDGWDAIVERYKNDSSSQERDSAYQEYLENDGYVPCRRP